MLSKLQLLLLNKLEDEQGRNCYLGSTAEQERNDAYTETDRAVRSLLDIKVDAGKSPSLPLLRLCPGTAFAKRQLWLCA